MKKKDFILSSALKLKGEGAKPLDLQGMERSGLTHWEWSERAVP